MQSFIATCAIAWLAAGVAPVYGADQALRLVQAIPLPGVAGRLDHMAVDLEKKRLFVAAVANGTLEVIDLERLYVASQAIGAQQAAVLVFEPVPCARGIKFQYCR